MGYHRPRESERAGGQMSGHAGPRLLMGHEPRAHLLHAVVNYDGNAEDDLVDVRFHDGAVDEDRRGRVEAWLGGELLALSLL
eukprot:scaffold82549_cov35-Tisochrysis_lutea.AAC.2